MFVVYKTNNDDLFPKKHSGVFLKIKYERNHRDKISKYRIYRIAILQQY